MNVRLLGVSALIVVSTTPAVGAGFMVSSQERARATALSQQAYVTFQSGDYNQALSLLSQADQLKPDQSDSWNLRGAILLKQKSYDKAQAAFARAVALDPNLWAAQFNLAEVFFQRKDFARARTRFERLLSQTDRFKEANKWELAQYKAYLSCLLMDDDKAAGKKLAKLPATGAATPAFIYAQAALAFSRKNPAQAQKTLAAAQASFPAALNDLFTDSLVQAGWQTPPMPLAALAANVPPQPPLSANLPVEIDPRLQAESAGPLPVADAPTRPIVAVITPAMRSAPVPVLSRPQARPAPAVAVETAPALRSPAGTDLENGGLLLDE